MPNWCSNNIVIEGDIQPVLDIINNSSDDEGLMKSLVSLKETELHELSKDSSDYESPLSEFSTIYGTKWDFKMSEIRENMSTNNEDTLSITVSSAWSPPSGFCLMLSKKFNLKIELIYSEPGCDFAGIEIYHDGDIIKDESWGYLEGLYNVFDEEDLDIEIENQLEYLFEDKGVTKDDVTSFLEKFNFLNNDEQVELKKSVKDNIKTRIKEIEVKIQRWDELAKDNEKNKHQLSTSERQVWEELLTDLKSL